MLACTEKPSPTQVLLLCSWRPKPEQDLVLNENLQDLSCHLMYLVLSNGQAQYTHRLFTVFWGLKRGYIEKFLREIQVPLWKRRFCTHFGLQMKYSRMPYVYGMPSSSTQGSKLTRAYESHNWKNRTFADIFLILIAMFSEVLSLRRFHNNPMFSCAVNLVPINIQK